MTMTATFISTLLGIAVGIIAFLPFFWIRAQWGKVLIVVVAVSLAAISVPLSNTYLVPEYESWKFQRDILNEPLFRTIAKYHPKEFKEFSQKIRKNLEEKGDINLVPVYSSELVNVIFNKHLQNAPDENVVLYLKATIDLYQYLYTQDPKAIVKLENINSAYQIDLDTLWADKRFQTLLAHLLDTRRFLIEAAIKTPVSPPDENQGGTLLQTVIQGLLDKYGEKTVQMMFSPAQTDVPANKMAQIFIDFYTSILNQGKENAGIIMRYMGAMKAKEIMVSEQRKQAMESEQKANEKD